MTDLQEVLPYVKHLQSEHRRLHEKIRSVQRALRTAVQNQQRPLLPAELKSLRSELAHHFQEEEGGGCIEEAVCRCPRLAHEAAELEHEHPKLLAALDEVLGQAECIDESAEAARQVEVLFSRFVNKLLQHEARENRMLVQAFNLCPENGD